MNLNVIVQNPLYGLPHGFVPRTLPQTMGNVTMAIPDLIVSTIPPMGLSGHLNLNGHDMSQFNMLGINLIGQQSIYRESIP